ncbi:MAG: MauE/DoxX family redox-associated membrane protein [Acidimicrobiales bacterium]
MIGGALGGAAALLVAAGALKLLDPTRTVGALAALGWPSAPWLVRTGAAVELGLGAATLVVGGPALPMLVAASYLGFALFVMAALRAETPIGTCGCFGQLDTPPRPAHVVVDGILAIVAVLAAATDAPALVDASWLGWLTAVAGALAGWGLFRSARAQSVIRG